MRRWARASVEGEYGFVEYVLEGEPNGYSGMVLWVPDVAPRWFAYADGPESNRPFRGYGTGFSRFRDRVGFSGFVGAFLSAPDAMAAVERWVDDRLDEANGFEVPEWLPPEDPVESLIVRARNVGMIGPGLTSPRWAVRLVGVFDRVFGREALLRTMERLVAFQERNR